MNQKLRILIVDDDRHMTHTLADILSLAGHEAVEAGSGTEALEKVRTLPFDCILTDIRMPEMNGVELHRQLHQSQPGLPVVLMTAFTTDELIRQGLDDGAAGVLDKPLDMKHLLRFFSALAQNRSIVVVDDDATFCRTLSDILDRHGFRVAQITDPHVAVEQIICNAQIILLDLKLNLINGLDILKKIRVLSPTLPVLVVTGYRLEMAKVIEGALDFQVSACLYKPLEIPELLNWLTIVQRDRMRSLLKKLPGSEPS